MSQRRAAMLLIVTDDGRLLLHHRDDKPGIAHPGCWAGFGGAVGVYSLDDLDNIDVTPFVQRAITADLAPLIRGQ
jgi:hypothetical protein